MARDVKQPSITCPKCGRTSYHPEDIRRAYCGFCHLWHNTRDYQKRPVVQPKEKSDEK